MKNKRKFRKALARIIWFCTAFVICVSAVLYQRGVFDFSFHIRNRVGSSVSTPVTTEPIITEPPVTQAPETPEYDDDYALQFTDALRAAKNIANVGAGILDGGEAVKFEFAEFDSLVPEGYELTYADFDPEGGMRLCRIDTGIDTIYDKWGYECYELYFYSEAKDSYSVPEAKRKIIYTTQPGVRLYMGYIITDDGETQKVYTSLGEQIYSDVTNFLIPALTRDKENNPLFILNDYRYKDGYYCFDAEGNLVLSDYNDQTDNRGLYFDYVPTYGLSDNNINVYSAVISIKTEITSEIPQTEPIIVPDTEPVTDEIPDTTENEGDVTIYTEEITEPPVEDTAEPPVEDTTQAPVDTDEVEYTDLPSPEDTAAPEDTSDEIGTEQITEEINDYSPIDETLPLEELTEELTEEVTEAPATDENTEEVTEEVTDAPETTEEPVTTEPPPQYVVVETIYSDELRFSYGYSEWYKITNYTYKEAYNFSEHYAAVVYPDNVLLFINEYGKIDYYLYRETNYRNPNGRRAFSIYAAPVLRGIDSVGSFYFDKGYVRIRQLDTDKIYGNPDWIVGEYDYLIDDYGRKFKIPADYDLIAYSDGVLLLERDGLYGYYSIEGKWIAQPIFTFARPFAEGLGVIGFKNGIKGVIDIEGNVVLPFEYTEISQVSTGIIAAYNGSWNFYGKVAKSAE